MNLSGRLKLHLVSQILHLVTVLAMGGAITMAGLAQTPEVRPHAAGDGAAKEEPVTPIPSESSSVTRHEWTAGGQMIRYTATAGNLLIRDDQDKANGSIFYVAYTEALYGRTRSCGYFQRMDILTWRRRSFRPSTT